MDQFAWEAMVVSYPVIFAPLMGKRSVIVEGFQNPDTPYRHNCNGPLLKRSIPVLGSLLSFLEIEEPSPSPLGQAIRQRSSATFSALQKTLPVKPEQITVHGSAIGMRSEPCAYLVWGEKAPGVVKNRQNFLFRHG